MPKIVKPRCANIKSRKFPQDRCGYAATKGEYCCRHWKHPRRFETVKTIAQSTRSTHAMVRKIQKWWRLRYGIYLAKQRSLAFFTRDICHNETELASFEPLQSIPRDYFFAIKDDSRFWAFDIRTLVIQYESSGHLENPYTKSKCDPKTLENFRIRIAMLRKYKKAIHYEQLSNLTPAQSWNLRVLDVCLRLDMLGYRIATQWFTELDIASQKHLYMLLFRIWHEQIGLTAGLQDRIVPGHDSHANRLFKLSTSKIAFKCDLDSVRRNNLNVIERIISSTEVESDKTLGAMYTVMSLCHVSQRCRVAYPWLC